MKELATKECVPCEKGAPRLKGQELLKLQDQLGHGWRVVQEHHLEKEFTFKNFREALDFTNKVGEIAEAAGHHPALLTEWGRTTVTWWTHKIGGLHRNDFIMAAKTDQLYEG